MFKLDDGHSYDCSNDSVFHERNFVQEKVV